MKRSTLRAHVYDGPYAGLWTTIAARAVWRFVQFAPPSEPLAWHVVSTIDGRPVLRFVPDPVAVCRDIQRLRRQSHEAD